MEQQCPICNKSLKSKQALGSHLYYNHGESKASNCHILKVRLASGETAILEIPTSICMEDVDMIKRMLNSML